MITIRYRKREWVEWVSITLLTEVSAASFRKALISMGYIVEGINDQPQEALQ